MKEKENYKLIDMPELYLIEDEYLVSYVAIYDYKKFEQFKWGLTGYTTLEIIVDILGFYRYPRKKIIKLEKLIPYFDGTSREFWPMNRKRPDDGGIKESKIIEDFVDLFELVEKEREALMNVQALATQIEQTNVPNAQEFLKSINDAITAAQKNTELFDKINKKKIENAKQLTKQNIK